MTDEKMREFEAYWASLAVDGSESESYLLSCRHAAQNAWQAATLNERERCALVAESAQYPTLAAGIRMPPTGTGVNHG